MSDPGEEPSSPSVPASGPNWICEACSCNTNTSSLTTCNVCGTRRPPLGPPSYRRTSTPSDSETPDANNTIDRDADVEKATALMEEANGRSDEYNPTWSEEGSGEGITVTPNVAVLKEGTGDEGQCVRVEQELPNGVTGWR